MSHHPDGPPVDTGGPRGQRRTGPGTPCGIAALFRCLLRCERGAAAVEFALSAPLLLGVLVPVADLGLAFAAQQQLQDAVQAGALYAATHPWNQNAPSAIASAVTAATPLSGLSASPSPYQMCGCPSSTSTGFNNSNSTSGITTAGCGSSCSNGETAGYYVVISAQRTYTPIVPYSLLGTSRTLTAQSTIRIR